MSIMVHHFTSKGKSKQYIQIHKKNNLKYQDRTSAPKLNTSFKQSELLFPHPYKLEVSVGKDFQLLFKMSPCLLDTPIA